MSLGEESSGVGLRGFRRLAGHTCGHTRGQGQTRQPASQPASAPRVFGRSQAESDSTVLDQQIGICRPNIELTGRSLVQVSSQVRNGVPNLNTLDTLFSFLLFFSFVTFVCGLDFGRKLPKVPSNMFCRSSNESALCIGRLLASFFPFVCVST